MCKHPDILEFIQCLKTIQVALKNHWASIRLNSTSVSHAPERTRVDCHLLQLTASEVMFEADSCAFDYPGICSLVSEEAKDLMRKREDGWRYSISFHFVFYFLKRCNSCYSCQIQHRPQGQLWPESQGGKEVASGRKEFGGWKGNRSQPLSGVSPLLAKARRQLNVRGEDRATSTPWSALTTQWAFPFILTDAKHEGSLEQTYCSTWSWVAPSLRREGEVLSNNSEDVGMGYWKRSEKEQPHLAWGNSGGFLRKKPLSWILR